MDQMIRYIEVNRNTYTRQAITDQLLARGNKPTDIESAWEYVEAEEQERVKPEKQPRQTGSRNSAYPPKPKVWKMPQFWLTLFGFVLGVPVLAGLVSALAGGNSSNGFTFLLIFLGLALVGAVIGSIRYQTENRAVARGLVWWSTHIYYFPGSTTIYWPVYNLWHL